MKEFKLQANIKLVLFVFALTMALAVLWINNNIITNLREGNKRQIEKIAESYSNTLSKTNVEDIDQELQYTVKYLIPSLSFPIIITSEPDEAIYAVWNINIPYNEEEHPLEYYNEVKKIIEKMDKNFVPTIITREDEDGNKIVVHKIHYGDQKIIKTISMLPYLNFGFAILFISIAAFGFQLIRINERNSIYAGMARETAHQLGTPISSLMGWVELLKHRMLTKKRNKILSSMKNDLNRLSEISDRFSKIGSHVNLKVVNLKSLLEKITLYMSERLPKTSNTNIILKINKNINILGDPVLLSWGFENLIKNSIDAIKKKNGKISLSVKVEDLNVMIFFKDNGSGIKQNDWNNIFRPGFSTKKRGWGLGLSLTQRIIKDIHNGDIIVESSSSRGTKIRVEIPLPSKYKKKQ